MMTLKYPMPVGRPHDLGGREPALFTLPPQGEVTISERDAGALTLFCAAIRERLPGPVRFTVHPHRIGCRTSVALHLEGRLRRCIDVLITVTGNTRWPQPDEYSHPRWYLTVPDTADAVYLLLHLGGLYEGMMAS